MSSIDTDKTITVRQGETIDFEFTQTRSEDGSAIDITGQKFKLTVRKNPNQPVLLALSSDVPLVDPAGSNPYGVGQPPTRSSIGVTTGTDGKWALVVSAVRTKSLPAGDFVYEIDEIKPDGSVATILDGGFTVVKELG